jgi:hypothetical protein
LSLVSRTLTEFNYHPKIKQIRQAIAVIPYSLTVKADEFSHLLEGHL